MSARRCCHHQSAASDTPLVLDELVSAQTRAWIVPGPPLCQASEGDFATALLERLRLAITGLTSGNCPARMRRVPTLIPHPWQARYDQGVRATLAPYPDRTLVDYLNGATRDRPSQTALLFKGRHISFAELSRLS